jgi:hypothetical protein
MEILAILFSPVIAVLVTLWLNERAQKRKDRLEIFKTLMMTRENNANLDFVKAVNAIDVVFHDKSKVREAWSQLYESYHAKELDFKKVSNNHTKLLEAMASDLGYKDQITWEHITSSYSPNWLNNDRQNEAEYKTLQMTLMRTTVQNTQQVTQED